MQNPLALIIFYAELILWTHISGMKLKWRFENTRSMIGFSILTLLSNTPIQPCNEEMQGTNVKAASNTKSMFCDHRAHSFTCVRAHFCGENKVYSFGGTDAARAPQSTLQRPFGGDDGRATTSVASNSIGATTTTGKLEGPVGECEGGRGTTRGRKGRRGKLD